MDAEVMGCGLKGDGAGEGTVGFWDALDIKVIEVSHEQVPDVVTEVNEEVRIIRS